MGSVKSKLLGVTLGSAHQAKHDVQSSAGAAPGPAARRQSTVTTTASAASATATPSRCGDSLAASSDDDRSDDDCPTPRRPREHSNRSSFSQQRPLHVGRFRSPTPSSAMLVQRCCQSNMSPAAVARMAFEQPQRDELLKTLFEVLDSNRDGLLTLDDVLVREASARSVGGGAVVVCAGVVRT